jgi:hypothetical protein
MAEFIGPFKFKGRLDDLVGRQCGDKTILQKITGPSREKVLTSESCELTRRNAGEFKLVTGDSALLRRALGATLDGVRDSGLNARMNGLMHHVSRSDVQSGYGYRHAGASDLSLLTGFDFSKALSLDNALPVPFEHSLDVITGVVRLVIPSFIARNKREYPKGATHFRIVSCAALVDFAQGQYANSIKSTELLPLSKKTSATICHDHRLTVRPGEVLLQVMGIEFYRVLDGKVVLLKGGVMKILEAVQMEKADKPALQDTSAMHEVMKPYTAKELHKITNRVFKRMPMQLEEVPAVDSSVTCCYESILEKLPDIV